MPSIAPVGNADNIIIGAANINLGAAGATPTTGAGFVSSDDGFTLNYSTELQDVTVGVPAVSVATFVRAISIDLSFTSLEFDLDLFAASGFGTRSTVGTTEKLSVGTGQACPTVGSLQAEFCHPCLDITYQINAWRTQPDGNFTLALNSGSNFSRASTFRVLVAQSNWAGTALDATNNLFEICCDDGV